jgi:D-methionine transport system ATP-binding protein
VAGGTTVLRIVFRDTAANQPVISQLSRQFGLDINILHGRIEEIQGAPFGTLVIQTDGRAEAVQAAINLLKSNHLSVEALGHVPGTLRAAG